MVTVEFRCSIDHKARGLHVVEVRKPLEVCAQMFLNERVLKARPPRGLRVATADDTRHRLLAEAGQREAAE